MLVENLFSSMGLGLLLFSRKGNIQAVSYDMSSAANSNLTAYGSRRLTYKHFRLKDMYNTMLGTFIDSLPTPCVFVYILGTSSLYRGEGGGRGWVRAEDSNTKFLETIVQPS